MRRFIPLLIVFLTALALAEEPAANIVDNGDFEDPDAGEMYQQFDKGDTIGAWRVDEGSVDLTGKWWDAASGKQSLDLNGDKKGAVAQDLATAEGKSYVIRFALAGNPDNENAEKAAIDVLWDDKVVATVEVEREHGKHHAMKWDHFSVAVKAASAKSTIKFASKTEGGWGPLIDDVTVKEGDVLDDPKSAATQPTTAP